MSVTTMHPVAAQLNQIEVELNGSFLERQDAIKAMLLALVCGEHVFILGPPGTGKSRMTRACNTSVTGATYFEAALSKNRPAEALLGPVDLKEYRENSCYVLQRAGFATDVELLFLDEIGKMSPTLGHELLALLNERVYHEVSNGRSVHAAPLHTAFTASNEVPTNESDDAAALWDRLLIRVIVDYLTEPRHFAMLLTNPVSDPTTRVDFAELKAVSAQLGTLITLSDDVVGMITALRVKFGQASIFISDRRWRASVKVLKAAAFLAGRTEVMPADLEWLRFTLWDTLDQVDAATAMCLSASNPYVEDLNAISKGLMEIKNGIVLREDRPDTERQAYAREVNAKLVKVRTDLDGLLQMGGNIPGFKSAADLHMALTQEIAEDFLQLPGDVLAVYLDKRKGLGNGEQS